MARYRFAISIFKAIYAIVSSHLWSLMLQNQRLISKMISLCLDVNRCWVSFVGSLQSCNSHVIVYVSTSDKRIHGIWATNWCTYCIVELTSNGIQNIMDCTCTSLRVPWSSTYCPAHWANPLSLIHNHSITFQAITHGVQTFQRYIIVLLIGKVRVDYLTYIYGPSRACFI